MKMFIGIVPGEDIYRIVTGIQNRFGDNRLEPHITLRPPVMVADKIRWIEAIEKVCEAFSPFRVELPNTGFFGKRVLFIEAVAPELKVLHKELLKAVKPFEGAGEKQEEHQKFNAHLTLGRHWCGFTPEDFKQMKALADSYLSKEPISFITSSIRVYHKPDHEKRYTCFKDIPLGLKQEV